MIELNQLKNNINIIDIRDNYNYNKGHIPNAINIPESKLLIIPNYYLKRNEIYYIYCKNGTRSSQVVNTLNQLGFKAVNINGGYNNYLLMK